MATASQDPVSGGELTCALSGCACAVDVAGYCSPFCAEHDVQRTTGDSWCRCGHQGCYFAK